jgi:hypothetical protein
MSSGKKQEGLAFRGIAVDEFVEGTTWEAMIEGERTHQAQK